MPTVRIELRISADQFVEWYRGTAKHVLAKTEEGIIVQFPASVLQRFVTEEGIRGLFELTYDDANRFVRIERVRNPTTGFDASG